MGPSDRIELVRDERGGVTVMVDRTPEPHVQPDDPLMMDAQPLTAEDSPMSPEPPTSRHT